MMDDLISRDEVIEEIKNADVCVTWHGYVSPEDSADIAIRATKCSVISSVEQLPSAQPEITPDGTLTVTVDADIASVGRILLSQAGTQRGGLYYKDALPELSHTQKSCEYCHEDSNGYVRPIEKNSHAWLVRRGRTMKLRVCFNRGYSECDILFCPMCGRRLTDG